MPEILKSQPDELQSYTQVNPDQLQLGSLLKLVNQAGQELLIEVKSIIRLPDGGASYHVLFYVGGESSEKVVTQRFQVGRSSRLSGVDEHSLDQDTGVLRSIDGYRIQSDLLTAQVIDFLRDNVNRDVQGSLLNFTQVAANDVVSVASETEHYRPLFKIEAKHEDRDLDASVSAGVYIFMNELEEHGFRGTAEEFEQALILIRQYVQRIRMTRDSVKLLKKKITLLSKKGYKIQFDISAAIGLQSQTLQSFYYDKKDLSLNGRLHSFFSRT